MPERHFHFNVAHAVQTTLVVIVTFTAFKFALNKWRIPGLTDLINYV